MPYIIRFQFKQSTGPTTTATTYFEMFFFQVLGMIALPCLPLFSRPLLCLTLHFHCEAVVICQLTTHTTHSPSYSTGLIPLPSHARGNNLRVERIHEESVSQLKPISMEHKHSAIQTQCCITAVGKVLSDSVPCCGKC